MVADSPSSPSPPPRGDAYPQIERQRASLRNIVAARLDRRLRGRVDPSDVVQDTFVEAIARLPQYQAHPTVSLSAWLRYLAVQKLAEVHRHHLGRQNRDVRRETRSTRRRPDASSRAIAEVLVDTATSPSREANNRERAAHLIAALTELSAIDREILTLRHYEGLGNQEVAALLDLTEPAASLRYARALQRLGRALRASIGRGLE